MEVGREEEEEGLDEGREEEEEGLEEEEDDWEGLRLTSGRDEEEVEEGGRVPESTAVRSSNDRWWMEKNFES